MSETYVDRQIATLKAAAVAREAAQAATPAPVEETIEPVISETEEIRQAQKTLENAKARVAEANKLRMQKAAADLAALKVREEEKLLLVKLNQLEVQKKWEEVQRLKDEKQLADYRAEQRAKSELEARVNAAQEEERKRIEHEQKLRKLSEESFQQEQLAKMLEEQAMRETQPAPEEPKPPTLSDGPLGFLFSGTERTPAAESEPVKQQEPVQAPELRPIQNSEMEAVAQHWQNKLRNRTTGNHVTPMLQRFTPEQIFAAIDALAQHPSAVSAERDVQAELISACLFQGTENLEQRIAEHLKGYTERIAAAKAQREGRQ
jgi:hypothetical protein